MNAATEWAADVTNPEGIGWWLAEGVRELTAERDRLREKLAELVAICPVTDSHGRTIIEVSEAQRLLQEMDSGPEES